MPLSRARDKARKHKERAKIRLDKLLSSLAESKPIQPKPPFNMKRGGWGHKLDPNIVMGSPRIDADGNVMPDYT